MLKLGIKAGTKHKHHADIHGHIYHRGQAYLTSLFQGLELKMCSANEPDIYIPCLTCKARNLNVLKQPLFVFFISFHN